MRIISTRSIVAHHYLLVMTMAALLLHATACVDGDPKSESSDTDIYVGDEDPFEKGELSTSQKDLDDAPVEAIAVVPEGDDEYPLVIFQHGFLMANSHYSELLKHLASHGFVVVAPQMYGVGGVATDTPTTEDEVELAGQLYDWADTELQDQIDVDVRTDEPGLAGHSRGGRVIFWSLHDDPRPVGAVAGVDPVESAVDDIEGEELVLDDPPSFDAPVLILGAGLGPKTLGPFQDACAPDGENYQDFFAVGPKPIWQVVAPNYGHLDMLDDETDGCGYACEVCVEGDSRAPMRKTTAGMLVALFRAALQGDDDALEFLSDEDAAPAEIDTAARL